LYPFISPKNSALAVMQEAMYRSFANGKISSAKNYNDVIFSTPPKILKISL